MEVTCTKEFLMQPYFLFHLLCLVYLISLIVTPLQSVAPQSHTWSAQSALRVYGKVSQAKATKQTICWASCISFHCSWWLLLGKEGTVSSGSMTKSSQQYGSDKPREPSNLSIQPLSNGHSEVHIHWPVGVLLTGEEWHPLRRLGELTGGIYCPPVFIYTCKIICKLHTCESCPLLCNYTQELLTGEE